MWRNYLTVGLRALAKHKSYTFINIFGLTIGFVACLMILLFVRHHMSYDAWLPLADRTYQLQSERVATEEPPTFTQKTFYPATAALKKDFAGVEAVAGSWESRPIIIREGQPSYVDMLLVDENFFDLLRLPFLRGNPGTALRDVDSLVLTEGEAERRFGSTDVIGRTLTVVRLGKAVDLRVTGILRDLPENSHLALGMVGRLTPAAVSDEPDALSRWNRVPSYTYVRLKAGVDPDAINAALPDWEQRVIPKEAVGAGEMSRADRWALHLENVRNVHLGRFQEAAMTAGSDRTTIATFAAIALLILGIAAVNFTNLTTARASQRAREVALRKVLGAMRRQLVAQFLGEAVLLALAALLTALAIVELTLPMFADFLGSRLTLEYVGPNGALLPALALALLVGLAGGLYPAFYLSGFSPAAVLKANQASGTGGSGGIRNALVVAQFAVSIALIVCTAVIYLQTQHARNADTGYQREGLLVVHNMARRQVEPLSDAITREVARLPGVASVGRADIAPASDARGTDSIELPGRAEPVMLGAYAVDAGFFGTMGIRTLAGRTFSERYGNDDSTLAFGDSPPAGAAANIVVSAAGARQLGFTDPKAAVGAQAKINDVPVTVVGVVADVQYRSLRDEIEPLYYSMFSQGRDELLVRYSSKSPAELVERLKNVWQRHARDVPFEADFAQDAVAELYEADQSRGTVFAVAAALAVVIGCLGLYALAAFTAERRTKEIGLRKVLGARTRDIVQLLVWQFSKPVVIANLIAWPVAWWVMRDWLNGFQDRISLNPALFVAAGLLALAIASATIVGHAVRVARANPIHALRYE